jgi:hypothetical protein
VKGASGGVEEWALEKGGFTKTVSLSWSSGGGLPRLGIR